MSIRMYAGILPSVHGGSWVARYKKPVRRDGLWPVRPEIQDSGVSRWAMTNSSVIPRMCEIRRRPNALVVRTNRTHYQGLVVSYKPIQKVGPMDERRKRVPCDGARQPRGRTRFPTRADAEAQEAVPSLI